MLDENNTQESNEVQDEQTSDAGASVDYKSLYLEEVQNAKKLRKRAQESEVQIQEYTKAQETQKVKQLRKQEKFQELSENLQRQLDEVTPYKERWESYETSRRESLLSQLPEEDREGLQGESLKTLEYITSKLNETKPVAPEPSRGAVRGQISLESKDYSEMTEAERRAFYTQKAQEQANFRRR